jgi:putative lipoic acid-binding regulatory protein
MDSPTEAPEDFPHLHHVKAIGQHDDLLAAVRSAITPHAPGLSETAFCLRASAGGKYQAVTCSLEVQSAAQLQAIYSAVQEIEGVMLCL